MSCVLSDPKRIRKKESINVYWKIAGCPLLSADAEQFTPCSTDRHDFLTVDITKNADLPTEKENWVYVIPPTAHPRCVPRCREPQKTCLRMKWSKLHIYRIDFRVSDQVLDVTTAIAATILDRKTWHARIQMKQFQSNFKTNSNIKIYYEWGNLNTTNKKGNFSITWRLIPATQYYF